MSDKTLRVDYHFHPNYPRRRSAAIRKTRRIYRAFAEYGIDTVIVTEHVYKDYRRAWEIMQHHAPDGFQVVPGLEYITEEGIDICLFAETPGLYEYDFRPFAMTFDEVIDFLIAHPDVHGFVTHPFTLGTTSIINKRGHHYTRHAIESIGAVEAAYSVYTELESIMDFFRLRHVIPSVAERISHNQALPEEFIPENLRFLAAGSDAHFASHVGTHAIVPLQNDDVFYSITHNSTLSLARRRDRSIVHMIMSAQITFEEWALKRLHRTRSAVRSARRGR